MAIDDDRQALTQRYLIQALRLAQKSGDTALGAHVLASMSDQARMLGYPREALQLAITGRHRLTRAYNPACAARLCIATVRDLQSRISPYRTVTLARECDHRAREMLARAGLNENG